MDKVDSRSVKIEYVEIIVYNTKPVICRVIESHLKILEFPIEDVNNIHEVDMNKLVEIVLEKLYLKLYTSNKLMEKDHIKDAIREIEENEYISARTIQKTEEMTRLFKDRKERFEKNKSEVEKDLKRKGYIVKFLGKIEGNDIYLFKVNGGKEVRVEVPMYYNRDWCISEKHKLYDIYNANDVLELLVEELRRPIKDEDHPGNEFEEGEIEFIEKRP